LAVVFIFTVSISFRQWYYTAIVTLSKKEVNICFAIVVLMENFNL